MANLVVRWFTIFTVGASVDFAKLPELRCISIATIVLSYLILLIFIAMASLSHPNIRAKHHAIRVHVGDRGAKEPQ